MKAIFKMWFGSAVEKWIRERALRVPDAEVERVSVRANVSVGTWRAMEAIATERAITEWRKW